MEIYAISGLINAITAVSLGLLVLAKGWKLRINQLFVCMTFSYSIWSISYWRWLSSHELFGASFWGHLTSLGSVFVPIFFFHWILILIGQERRRRSILVLFYLEGILCLFVNSSNLFLNGFDHKLFFEFWPNAGSLYWIYIVGIYVIPVLYGLVLLLRTYHSTSSNILKHQIIYIVTATIMGFGGGLTNFFLWYNIMIPPYGNFLVVLFPFLLSYAVLKHHLFNIKVIAIELSVFALWIFILVRTILTDNVRELFIQGGLLIMAIILGLILIRGVLREIKDRKKIEELAEKLQSLNHHLSDKVAEQTREIRAAYEVEKKARRDLEKLNDSKDQFIMITQHHLRTPVTSIDWELESMLAGGYGPITPELKTAVTGAQTAAKRLTHIIDDFLNIAALKAGGSILNLSQRSLKPAIADILDELKLDIARMRVSIVWADDVAQWPEITVDYDKMREVLLIVMENAIKYNHEGGSIDIGVRTLDGRFEVSIRDSGMGITPEEIGKIGSSLFYRGNSARSINPTGMGIGLSVAKAIVNAHHGAFSIEPNGKGEGTKVTITLPLKQSFEK